MHAWLASPPAATASADLATAQPYLGSSEQSGTHAADSVTQQALSLRVSLSSAMLEPIQECMIHECWHASDTNAKVSCGRQRLSRNNSSAMLYLSAYGGIADNGCFTARASALSTAIRPGSARCLTDSMAAVQHHWIVQQLGTSAAFKALCCPSGCADSL